MTRITTSLFTTLLIASLASSYCHAAEFMDDYYSDDLQSAIDKAKDAPHHYDYSRTYRYKRTTSQSIQLQRVEINEMEETSLEGALSLSNSAADTDANEKKSIKDVLDQIETSKPQNNESSTGTPNADTAAVNNAPILIDLSRGSISTPNGNLSSQGIINYGGLTSVPRP